MASLSKDAGGIKNFHFIAKAEDVDPHSLD